TCSIASTSFIKYEPMDIFGRDYLRLIFPSFRKSLFVQLDASKMTRSEFSLGDSMLKYILLPEFVYHLERKLLHVDKMQTYWHAQTDVGQVIGGMMRFASEMGPCWNSVDLAQLEHVHLTFE